MNAKDGKTRKKHYQDLLAMTRQTLGYARSVVSVLKGIPSKNPATVLAAGQEAERLKELIELTRQVVDQTTRRVIRGESVPASEKIVSIFEPHTDIIVKDRR